jgi:formate hydrogenlyase subunit 3/multisubunit Na+/H+ antiporter MnhD subunit
MEKLGGLIKQMPKTAILFLIGAIAIGGMPPFNGFVSEFILYNGLIEGLKTGDITQTRLVILSFAGLSLIGGLSILTFSKTFGVVFLGSPRKKLHTDPQEVSKIMLFPQYIIVAVMLLVAFFPRFFLNNIQYILQDGLKNIAIFSSVASYSDNIVAVNYYLLYCWSL